MFVFYFPLFSRYDVTKRSADVVFGAHALLPPPKPPPWQPEAAQQRGSEPLLPPPQNREVPLHVRSLAPGKNPSAEQEAEQQVRERGKPFEWFPRQLRE